MPIGGGEANHTYRVTEVPEGCKAAWVGQEIRLEVVEPAPQSITLNFGGLCVGVVAILVT